MTTVRTEETTAEELDAILAAAESARPQLAALPPEGRAQALRRVADALDAAVADLVPLAHRETGLPVEPRLVAELGRTTFQLRLLAEEVVDGGYLEAVLDSPDPDWPAGGRPDVRRMLHPLGPVVVFAASNFPFAFSVAGGDTAAALAVGCPVVLKAHPGHPQLSALTASLVDDALGSAGLPGGTFAIVYGEEAGRAAVLDPRVKAGAFTGSITGGRALFDLASSRPEPIPFYAELGSVNPVFVTESAARSRGADIAEGYLGSFTLGQGQFCTKPGLLFVPEQAAPAMTRHLVDALTQRPAGRLLNERIADGYTRTLSTLADHATVRVLAAPDQAPDQAASQDQSRNPDQAASQAPGQAASQAPGQASDQAPGQASDQAPGQASDQAPGQVTGQASDQASGQAPDQALGQAPDQALGQAPGRRSAAEAAPTLLGVSARDLLAHWPELVVECFGPTSVVVDYSSEAELVECARRFTGELTATVHGEGDDPVAADLLAELSDRAGRVLWNGWPTGVAVTYAMHHGGPYPATTAPLHTSVGTTSLRRFLRPVAYQNMPQHLLPVALRDGNPLDIPRRQDGVLSRT